MTETQATRAMKKMEKETKQACKVIHIGNGKYTAVIIGSNQHIASLKH